MNAGAKRHLYFLSIGSNLEPAKHIPACIAALKNEFTVKKISSVYETQPVGPTGPDLFWNLAAEIETPLEIEDTVKKLRKLEAELGRKRNPGNKFLPRTIDLDLLPQKDYQKQAFIMIPLAEISPRTLDPESGKSFQELAETLKSEGSFFRIVSRAGSF